MALTTRGENEGDNKILDRELTTLKKINDNYPKYILTLDDDLDADFDGIKKNITQIMYIMMDMIVSFWTICRL